jgi:hypothetical protein
MGIKTTLNFMLISTAGENANNLLTRKLQAKQQCKIGECINFWQITFSGCTFFQLFQRILNLHKILRIFDIHIHIQNTKKNLGGGSLSTCMSIFWMHKNANLKWKEGNGLTN